MSYLTQMAGLGTTTSSRLGWHRAGDRVHPRHLERATRLTRQFLGRHDEGGALGAAARLYRGRAPPRVAGSRSEPQTVRPCAARRSTDDDDHRRREADHLDDHGAGDCAGPVASQEIIKEWGTNGGGFFNANSAHPFENPTPLTNFIQMFAIFAISAGLTYTLGRMTKSPRHGWAVWGAMAFLFLAGVTVAYWAEAQGNPLLTGTDQTAGAMCPGGNMEGKEARFGIASSALFATVTTAASCGAVNSMHDSYTPLGGMVPLVNMMLGEVIFGGVGAGMYGILVFVVLSVFIAGLMVGRTPEYLGQEDRGLRRADGDAGHSGLPAHDPGLHGDLVGLTGLRDVQHLEPRAARPLGGPLCLHVSHREQRVGLRRHLGEHQVVQRDPRRGDAGRPLHDHRPDARAGGESGRKALVPPSLGTFPVTTPLFAAFWSASSSSSAS